MSPHLPPTACIVAFAVIVAVLVLGFIAIALDDWAGKVIARHVERALNEGEVAVTESGHRIGDPCEAIEAMFVYGPSTCMKTSVAFAVDAEWGTTHVVCEEHATHAEQETP